MGMTTDTKLDQLNAVLSTLSVSLITVPRSDWMTCTPDDHCSELAERNKSSQFSTIPVVVDGKVLGLHNAARWFEEIPPASPLGADYEPLSEDILIADDASIFDFVRQADRHPTNLVVKGTSISGLVSLSDIQQLPVRAALFTLVTSFEMMMADLIARAYPDTAEWKSFLTSGRRTKLEAAVAEAKRKDVFASELLFTQFCDKRTIVVKHGLEGADPETLEARIKAAENLRDSLAHANAYADTTSKAQKVCAIVRDIYELKSQILLTVQGLARGA